MGGLMRPEYLIPLLLLVLLLLGPKRIPEMGSAIGKTIKEFQRSMREPVEPKDTTSALPPAPAAQASQIASPLTVTPAEPAPTPAQPVAADPAQH